MENGKYYVPTIEEWRVGFEYEERREVWDMAHLSVKVLEYIWEPIIGNLSSEKGSLNLFTEGINPDRKEKHYRFTSDGAWSNMIRVKYLDREDIESLGWKCIEDYKSDKDGTTHLTFEMPYRRYPQQMLRLNYIVETGKLWIFVVMDIHYYHNTFKGYIKNKSELKIIMKQLSINQ